MVFFRALASNWKMEETQRPPLLRPHCDVTAVADLSLKAWQELASESMAAIFVEVKMATVYLGFFPTTVTEEKLEEAREKSIRRIFGSTDTLRYMKSTEKVGTYKGILQKKTEEHCQAGNQYFSQGEWERAITCFSKALNLDPKKKAEAFLQLCDFQSAVLHLRKAYSIIACLAALKRYNDCLQMVNEEVAQEKKNPDLFVLRARLYEHFGKVTLGNILRRLKDFDAAIDDYLKAVDLSKEEEGSEVRSEAQKQVLLTYNDFAVHCYGKGCYEEAVLLLNKAIKGEKNEKGLYMNRGDCFLKLGELNFAMADYQQALELRPFNPNLQKRIGWLHNEMGLQEFRESRLFLQEVMGAKEDIATALLLDPLREETHTLVNNFFPGEQIHSIVSGKIGELARALLARRLAAYPADSAPSNQEGLESKEPPKDIYVENKDPEMAGEVEEKKEKQPDSEEKRLYERVVACQIKTNKVNQEVKEVLENRASLESTTVRLNSCPSLPEKVSADEPCKWKKFSHGAIHL
ncbi:hypothetical protein JD844_005016 [Phrynosoma platyrhinos]|uniref:Tetratricopeptide repeat protein 16 n=1 Tax=Phrynosoma platyrhinos TaxID=52577 RepID=A0ABQ7SE24_PHRPL|nr:hypothetical protein JD844_005016 [Phrynosoma platyrhinos]